MSEKQRQHPNEWWQNHSNTWEVSQERIKEQSNKKKMITIAEKFWLQEWWTNNPNILFSWKSWYSEIHLLTHGVWYIRDTTSLNNTALTGINFWNQSIKEVEKIIQQAIDSNIKRKDDLDSFNIVLSSKFPWWKVNYKTELIWNDTFFVFEVDPINNGNSQVNKARYVSNTPITRDIKKDEEIFKQTLQRMEIDVLKIKAQSNTISQSNDRQNNSNIDLSKKSNEIMIRNLPFELWKDGNLYFISRNPSSWQVAQAGKDKYYYPIWKFEWNNLRSTWEFWSFCQKINSWNNQNMTQADIPPRISYMVNTNQLEELRKILQKN